jgi:hypothetical protein
MLDRGSPTWLTLRRKIRERIEKLRDDLEVVGADPDYVRGQIAGLRWVIETVEPDAPITDPTSTDYLQVGDSSTHEPDPS